MNPLDPSPPSGSTASQPRQRRYLPWIILAIWLAWTIFLAWIAWGN